MKKKKSLSYYLIYIILFAGVIITLFPIYLMIATSTKTTFQFATNFWGVAFPPHLENYATAWNEIGGYFFNTLKVAVMEIAGTTITAVLAGYAFHLS